MAQARQISVHDVQARRQNGGDFLLIDCREPEELAIASIEGAENYPLSTLGQRLPELEALDRSREIIIFCHHGRRSQGMADFMVERGFQNALSMAGGIDAWSREIDSATPRY